MGLGLDDMARTNAESVVMKVAEDIPKYVLAQLCRMNTIACMII